MRTISARRAGSTAPRRSTSCDESLHSRRDRSPHGWGAGTADDYTSFRLGKHWDDWGRVESHSDNEVSRLVVGAEGDINDNWTWDAYYQIAYNSRHQYLLRQPINNNFTRALNVVINPANNQPICAALLSTNPRRYPPLRVACRSILSA